MQQFGKLAVIGPQWTHTKAMPSVDDTTMNRRKWLQVGGVLAVVFLAFFVLWLASRHSQPSNNAATSYSTPDTWSSPSPDDTSSDSSYEEDSPMQDAITNCEAMVTTDSHLDPSILTFTDEIANKVDHRWAVTGYVNHIEFQCLNIALTKDGTMNVGKSLGLSVYIGGVETRGPDTY